MAGRGKVPPKSIVEAARRGDRETLARLVEAGGDINAAYRGYRAVHALIQETPHSAGAAVDEERTECLRWLLEQGADPELPGAWPPARALLIAAFQGTSEWVKVLIEGGARHKDGFAGAALGEVTRVRRILAKNADFVNARDEGGLTALQCAAASRLNPPKTLAIARLLLEGGADARATTRGWDHDLDAAYFAIQSGQRELFELLLDYGVEATSTLPGLLWKRRFEWAEGALGRGGVLDQAVDAGKPLLNQLVRWGQIEAAMWMVRHGASPNLPDERGWTAVHQAASRGNLRMLQALLDSGGDPQRRDREGRSPWEVAEEMGQLRTMALLPNPLPPSPR